MVNKIQLCKEGPELSEIVLGLWRLQKWNVNEDELLNIIETSIDLGITSFDHADIYGSFTCEEIFGNVLKKNKHLRKKIELVTKCDIVFQSPQRPQYNFHYYDTTKKHIIESVNNSLENFGTDYIDILLIHRPDPLMNADETAEALTQVVNEGKVKHVGVSNFTPSHFNLLQSRLNYPVVTNQVEFSVMYMQPMEDGTFDQAQQLRRSPMIWSPLGGGRIFTEDSEQANRLRDELNKQAEKYNVAIDQIALAWVMMHPSKPVTVIGTGNIDRIKGAAGSVDIKLSREDWFRIWTASKGHEVP